MQRKGEVFDSNDTSIFQYKQNCIASLTLFSNGVQLPWLKFSQKSRADTRHRTLSQTAEIWLSSN